MEWLWVHLGLLMVNVLMCHLEEQRTRNGLMPNLYGRDIDDTLARMLNTDAATMFLNYHPEWSKSQSNVHDRASCG